MGSRGPLSKKETFLNFSPGVPEPPDWLDDVAKTEYRRVAAEMETAGKDHLQQVDLSDLAVYAQGWAEFVELTVIVRHEERVLQSKKGGSYLNPNANALQMACNRMTKAASRLGFSPSDRNRSGSKGSGKQVA